MAVETFSATEILSLLGLIQSVYVLVYMTFRSGNWRYSIIPMAYFTVLGAAFLLDAAQTRWEWRFENYGFYQWAMWFSGVPLGVLLIFQVARTPALPSLKYALLLLVIPVSLGFQFLDPEGDQQLIYVSGLLLGALSLLTIWFRRDMLSGLIKDSRAGGERFWLIIALIAIHTAFLCSSFAYISEWLDYGSWVLVRTILGLGVVYIAATSLFRIYPQAVKFVKKSSDNLMTDDEKAIIERLKILFEREKIYQEPEFGRAELARELNVGEAMLSRLINLYYGKTIPQMLNDLRVKDAQRLLIETDAPVSSIFMESGFSSMTTFNRVFKEIAGVSPTEFRSVNKR